MNKYWSILTDSVFYPEFFSFRLMPFSIPGPHPRYHLTFSCQVSLGSSWLWHFDNLDSFEEHRSIILVGWSCIGIYLIFFMIRITVHTINEYDTIVESWPDHLTEAVFVRLLQCKVTLPLLSTLNSLGEVAMQPILREWKFSFISSEGIVST